jgi:uncharacterized protein YggU (UPF0235/DUF167 family)
MMPLLAVHVKPRARTACVRERDGEGRLILAVRSAAEGGAANREATRLVAEALGVPARSVRVVRGATARRKTLRIDGVTEEALVQLGRRAAEATAPQPVHEGDQR